jgi:hypothetical protein
VGELDEEQGEFWVENPFMIPLLGENLSAFERNCLFWNVDGETFLDASFASAADIDSDSRSVVAADFDRDGAVDLLVGSVGGGSLRLFQNRVPQQNHLRLQLSGKACNRQGIGARIAVRVGQRRIYRDVFPANGFMGQGPGETLIGVGAAERIDELEVRWPDGSRQILNDVAANQTLLVEQSPTADGDPQR